MVKVKEVEKRETWAASCHVSESATNMRQAPARHAAT